jgi:hypothetical protein
VPAARLFYASQASDTKFLYFLFLSLSLNLIFPPWASLRLNNTLSAARNINYHFNSVYIKAKFSRFAIFQQVQDRFPSVFIPVLSDDWHC